MRRMTTDVAMVARCQVASLRVLTKYSSVTGAQLCQYCSCLVVVVVVDPTPPTCCQQSPAPNHVAASILSPQVARKGSTLSGFVQRSRLERDVGRDLHSNKWEEV